MMVIFMAANHVLISWKFSKKNLAFGSIKLYKIVRADLLASI